MNQNTLQQKPHGLTAPLNPQSKKLHDKQKVQLPETASTHNLLPPEYDSGSFLSPHPQEYNSGSFLSPHPQEYNSGSFLSPHPQERITHYVFSRRLIHVMGEYPMRSIELARRIYVSRSTISGYRTGRRIPDLERLRLICVHLHVSADYLLGLKESP